MIYWASNKKEGGEINTMYNYQGRIMNQKTENSIPVNKKKFVPQNWGQKCSDRKQILSIIQFIIKQRVFCIIWST